MGVSRKALVSAVVTGSILFGCSVNKNVDQAVYSEKSVSRGAASDVDVTLDEGAQSIPETLLSQEIASSVTEVPPSPMPLPAEAALQQEVIPSLNAVSNASASISVQGPELKSIQLIAGDDPALLVVLSAQVPFLLEKAAPTEYVLTLIGARELETKVPAVVAAPGKSPIRSARVAGSGDSLQVRMFVDAGVELAGEVGAEGLVVKPIGSMSSARAQLAAGKSKESEDPAKKKAESPAPVDSAPEDDSARKFPTGLRSADGSKVYTGRLISLDLQDTDIDNALRIIAEVSQLNIIASDDVRGKVTLRLIDVPWDQALDVILKTNGLDQVTEGNVIRIAPVDKLRTERESLLQAKRAQEELEDLQIAYIRVSYARASEIQAQIQSVLSERGQVTFDDRTNQLIIKDIGKGQAAALELVRKLDLRTPQILLETQIVEAQKGLLRDLGFQWNYSYKAGPEYGNSTGMVFPNSYSVGGGTGTADNPMMVDFPAAIAQGAGSAITGIFESADGSQTLAARLSAVEQEGLVKIVSQPQVATVNNKAAEIKSVETVRIPTPDSGTSIATGAGASAAGGGSTAFEEFDVGIELKVTPQASPDYYVLLDVQAKSSTFGDRVVKDIPSTIEREATSTVLIKDGQTFVMGGVYRIFDRDTVNGVPYLKDIPVLGHLFRRSLVDKKDEELLFFITPHIVEGSFDAGTFVDSSGRAASPEAKDAEKTDESAKKPEAAAAKSGV